MCASGGDRKMAVVRGRKISGGVAEGNALVSKEPISFFGGVDPDTGMIVEKRHELEGRCIKDTVLVFPHGRGSTVGSYTLYRMKKNGVAPKAIVNLECEPIVAVGAIISDIPAIDKLERNPLDFLRTGTRLKVNAEKSTLEILD
jgi:predicted aconitase with swiveling domain